MGKAVFILDRDDFKRYAAVLPKTDRRSRLESRLKKTHREYRSQLQREGTLAAEIASVTRELARKSDPDLTARMGTLFVVRECWPVIMRDCSEAYVTALAEWARVTWQAFDDLFREADDAARVEAPEFQNLVRRQNSLRRNDDPQHAVINAKINEIQARARPHIKTRTVAQQGRAAVEAFVNMALGTQVQRGQVSDRDIAAFVNRHASRKVAA